MALPRHERIKYVRTNLPSPRDGSRVNYMTHDDFAKAVGASSRTTTIRWESGTEPTQFAQAIAALTPYPPAAFGGEGAEALFEESTLRRLRSLEKDVREAVSLARRALALLEAPDVRPGGAAPGSRRRGTGTGG